MEATKQRKRKTVSVPEMAPAERDRRLRETEMLLSVTRRVAATDTLDDILETLVEIITAETGAERGSLFLNDSRTNELYSRVALGEYTREIRVMNTTGVAGHVYTAGVGIIVTDAYADEHFNAAVDEQGGFVTKSILCAPVKTVTGDVIGVAQTLNKLAGRFTKEDLALLEAMCTQASAALRSSQFVEQLERSRAQELEFLDVVSDVTTEIDISTLVRKVMSEATRMLNAERSTLFLNDDKTAELWSEVGEGLEATQIRLPNHVASPAPSTRPASPSTSHTPTPTCALTRRSTSRPATSRARSCACRSSTRTARRSASPKCSTSAAGPSPTRTNRGCARLPHRSP